MSDAEPGSAPSIGLDWLTLGQAAQFLGVAQSTVRKWSDQGSVKAFYTPGGHRRYRRADLEDFLDRSGPGERAPGPLVLVVDADEQLRALLRGKLEREGYSVCEAAGVEQTLSAFEDQAPALVLLDVVMPGLDGWQLLQRLQERFGSIPLLMFSGKPAAGELARRGARGFIGTAFDPVQLVERAKALLPA